MESRENMIPAEETKAPEAPSSYQLALTTNTPTNLPENPSGPITGPPGFSPATGGMPSSLAKKKRGRPRKYGPDGVAVSGGASGRTLSPMPLSSASSPASGSYSDIKFGDLAGSGGEFQAEKKKRRKMFSSDKSNMSLGDQITSGGSFTPHMVIVNPGEDVTSKIFSFSKNGPRAVCVLSALGVVSRVTLRQASSSGGTVTYEGRFEILSLSGSFTPGEVGTSREGGMSIALSSPDGRVVGGLLAGLLTAAAPVQVVVASFLPEVGNPLSPKPRKQKNIIKIPRITNADHQNTGNTNSTPGTANANSTPGTGNTNTTPAPNFLHDWRRDDTDRNLPLRED